MRNLVGLCIAIAVLSNSWLAPGGAYASTLATTSFALDNGLGPDGGKWRGSQDYFFNAFINVLDVTAEFAVFAPGDFQGFLGENLIDFTDPAPGEYIYAYQIVDIDVGSTGLTNFSVGLDGNESLGAVAPTFIPFTTDYGTYSPTPTQDPSQPGGGPGVDTSSVWADLPGFGPGEVTGVLFYSSPHQPELGFSTATVGIAGQQMALSLPNPVPEPTGLCLALGTCVLLCLRRVGHTEAC